MYTYITYLHLTSIFLRSTPTEARNVWMSNETFYTPNTLTDTAASRFSLVRALCLRAVSGKNSSSLVACAVGTGGCVFRCVLASSGGCVFRCVLASSFKPVKIEVKRSRPSRHTHWYSKVDRHFFVCWMLSGSSCRWTSCLICQICFYTALVQQR